MCRLWRLSIVRIFPKDVVHVKKVALKGALGLLLLFQGEEQSTLGRKLCKKFRHQKSVFWREPKNIYLQLSDSS